MIQSSDLRPTLARVGTLQRVGVIGVGEIGKAVVEGLRHDGDPTPEIHLSPRGASADLAERYEAVHLCTDNQQVVDRSDLVLIAVRGPDRHSLAGLHIPGDKIVVNVMAGISNDDLRSILDTVAPLVRAIPLPAVRERMSVTVVHPSDPVVNAMFDVLGGALPVADEAAFDVFSALTGTLTSHYAFLVTLAEWASSHGIAPDDADRYVRGLFENVGRSLGDETRTLPGLAADHETPNGSNERIRTTWFVPASAGLRESLDALLTDLRRP
ncbi:NAD(P)-binding domain-containing protein [Lentzea sp. CA-135723]|uniref:NAD(P)-binding domain-containing protein n=1 Tax=Lentzea sp. CA-135723 TaxID=3239950 RepID=UPI003D8B9303